MTDENELTDQEVFDILKDKHPFAKIDPPPVPDDPSNMSPDDYARAIDWKRRHHQ
jgi:hypothetical protein